MLQFEGSLAAGCVAAPATPTIAPTAEEVSASTGRPDAIRVPARRAIMTVDSKVGECILRVREGVAG